MNNSSKVISNEYLFNSIVSYLTIVDIVSLCSVNKKSQKLSNKIWNEIIRNYYSSSYEEYSILITPKQLSIKDHIDYSNDSPIALSSMNWKNLFLCGRQIQSMWTKITSDAVPSVNQSCIYTKDKVFSILKEFWSLPPLRKANLYVENELNTYHQTFLYDFLYDTQDTYEYYKNQLEKNEESVVSRKRDLPFADCLGHLEAFCKMEDDELTTFENLRFYNTDIKNFEIYNQTAESANQLFLNFPSNFSSFYESNFEPKKQNPLISIMLSLYMSILFFCLFTYSEIVKHKENKFLFLDNFSKRYKAFSEGAVNINNELENLNVLVNIIYQRLCNDKVFPRFSVYRMMMILFNRIVVAPLMGEKDQSVVEKISKIYEIYLKEEFKNYESGKKKVDEIESKTVNYNSNTINIDQDDELSSMSTYQSLVNDIVNVNCKSNNESFDIDCQIVQFLEQIPQLLLDGTCDEYSVFYINSSKFPISGNYKIFQDKFINTSCNLVNSLYSKDRCDDLLFFFKDNEYINTRFINKSKTEIIISIADAMLNNMKNDTIEEFNTFLMMNDVNCDMSIDNESDGNKSEQSIDILDFPFYFDLLDYIQNEKKITDEEENQTHIEKFLIKFSKSTLYRTICDTTEWIYQTKAAMTEEDSVVIKEAKRRNILLTKSIYNERTWSYELNMSPDDIVSAMMINISF